jgi:hypothetical protein
MTTQQTPITKNNPLIASQAGSPYLLELRRRAARLVSTKEAKLIVPEMRALRCR